MAKTYAIYKMVDQPTQSSIILGIHRSDYLLHQGKDQVLSIQQVELNTIAVSFSSLSAKVSDLHRYISKLCSLTKNRDSLLINDVSLDNLPLNSSLEAVPKALSNAWKLYGVDDAVIVMVVQPNERNSFDQRFIEHVLLEKHSIKLIQKSLLQMHTESEIINGHLVIDSVIVAVTYFRAGYAPTDYPSQKEWDARLKIEQSSSIKCPNVAYHLVGSKKVQQVLALPGMLERYIEDPTHIAMLRSSFAGLYSLDDTEEGRKAVEMALRNPEDYVLKPQREGGGNNVYGKDIPAFLNSISVQERRGYILMDLIKTPDMRNVMVRKSTDVECAVISELGIYGVFLAQGENVIMNEACGHLLRTKCKETSEGGVATGFSVLDSPLLY